MIAIVIGLLAAVNVDAGTIIPVGTVTGMLVAILVAFFRDSARQDDRVDKVNSQLVAQAEKAAEQARERERILEQRLVNTENHCAEQISLLKREFEATRSLLYNRIKELESKQRSNRDPEVDS